MGIRRKPQINTVPDIQRRVEVACKRISVTALQVLEDALNPTKTPQLEYRWRIQAAKEILDRAWGRPKFAVETVVKHETVDGMTEALKGARKRAQGLVEALPAHPDSPHLH